MKALLRRSLKALPIVLPLLFVLFFFGYLTPNYDVIFRADNVVGDGSCMVNLSAPRTYMHYYYRFAPLNSQQGTVIAKDIHYDVTALDFYFSSISEADFQSYEVRWLGRTLMHVDFKDLLSAGEYGRFTLSLTPDGENVHVVVEDPEQGFTLKVSIDCITPAMWVSYWAVFLVLALLLASGMGALFERFPILRFPLASLAGIVTVLLAGCFFCNSLPDVDYTCFLLNAFLLFGTSLVLSALTTPLFGPLTMMFFVLSAYIADYYTIRFRGRPAMPADLAAIGTAREVLGGYDFTVTWQMILGIAVCVVYAIGLALLCRAQKKSLKKGDDNNKKPLKFTLWQRGASLAFGIMILGACTCNPFLKSINNSPWNSMATYNFHKNGMVLTFLKYAKNSVVTMPEGYTREAIEEYLKDYMSNSKKDDEAKAVTPTNIIMVMNEAFSDLRTAGMDERINVMPFIDSLYENTIEGNLYVSVIGGGTCNTEFEALTGNTLAFFGTSAYPYSQYVNRELFSLASYFQDMGYLTTAFHANEAHNWNRDKVYPLLGFEVFHAIDDYPEAAEDDYLHGYLSDLANYRYLESVAEENSGFPRFSFNVTMQNHSGFEKWENVKEAESVRKYGAELELDAQVYLSLVKASDDAVKQLVETYQDSDEPTMIIFFGDHQPSLSYDAGMEIYGGSTKPEDLLHTRFFIWTNYKSEADHNVAISANYLPWLIMERAGFPLPPYIQMLRDVHEKYPVITTAFVIGADGTTYEDISDVADDPLVQMYRYVQYANVFDKIDPAWFKVQ